jgi:NitT/TauT family transport system substrate-binding protein
MFRRALARVTPILLALLVASSGVSAAQPKLTTIHFISSPSDDLRPILYAQNAGLFRQAGLDVVVERAGTGAVVAQAIAGGAMDIGKASITSIIAAYARGLPFVLVAPSILYRKEAPTSGIVVAANSPFRSPLDLQGKVVACTAIGDIGYLGLRALIDSHGGDSSTLRWIELPTSAVTLAVEQGRVDAGLITEPYMMQSVRAGKVKMLVDMLSGYPRPILESVFFAKRDYVEQNRGAVTRFAKALQQAAVYSDAHVADTVPLYVAFSGMDPKVAAEMRHTYTATSFNPAQIQPVIDLAAKYKIIPHAYDARELMSTVLTAQ